MCGRAKQKTDRLEEECEMTGRSNPKNAPTNSDLDARLKKKTPDKRVSTWVRIGVKVRDSTLVSMKREEATKLC